MKLLITRPYKDSLKSKKLIESKTQNRVDICPLIEVEYIKAELNIKPRDNVIITSTNALEALHDNCSIKNFNLYLVGRSSLNKAKELGYKSLFYSEESLQNSNSENLANYIIDKADSGKEFIHITSDNAKDNVKNHLEAMGITYKQVILYKVQNLDIDSETAKKIAQGYYDGYLFFSGKTAQNFLESINKLKLNQFLKNKKIFCLSEKISGVFNECDGSEIIFPEQVNIDSFVEKLG
jgi:uroporphyrinogen-III synthase